MAPVSAPVHRLSVEDVYRMVEAGVLDEDDRVELVEGVLVDMVPIGPEHDGALVWLNRQFADVERAWEVRPQCVLLVSGGYLLPDLLITAALPRNAQPTTAHLVIEIAQTSQARDLAKAGAYAAADVDEYWIVDLPARAVTVHRDPIAGAYTEVAGFADGDVIKPLLADAPAVDVTALLG